MGPYSERPTLLIVWAGPITQDIAAVLTKCQHNFAVYSEIRHSSLVDSRWLTLSSVKENRKVTTYARAKRDR